MVNNSSAERVQKQMVLIMAGCFLWITYFIFQDFFKGIYHYFAVIPSWWLLVIGPLFGVAVLWSIHRDELAIKEAEANWVDSQRRFAEIELQFRLIKSNFFKMSAVQFVYYCADLLRALGYQRVELVSEENVLQVIDPSGRSMLVYCLHGSEGIEYDETAIQTLKEKMARSHLEAGLFMTCANLTEVTTEIATQHNIKCYNGTAISKLVWLVIEESKEKAQSI